MADDVHVHQAPNRGGGGMGWVTALVAVVVLILVAWFLFASAQTRDSGTTIEVPDRIEIEVDAPSGGQRAP